MVSTETFIRIALSFEGVVQTPHFNRVAFKITGRKIFATLLEEAQSANLLLSKTDQAIYCAYNEAAVYPVPNKFGSRGWTSFELTKIPVELIADALLTTYRDAGQTKTGRKNQ